MISGGADRIGEFGMQNGGGQVVYQTILQSMDYVRFALRPGSLM